MKFLNVGGATKEIPVPIMFDGWEHHLLDINKNIETDICEDAKNLINIPELEGKYDAIYCSHALEHFYLHDVDTVLRGFNYVTNENGICYIIVPSLRLLFRRIMESNLELTDVIYRVENGFQFPITAHDMIFGSGKHMQQEKEDKFYAHKCGFFPNQLVTMIANAGFPYVTHSENFAGDFGLTVIGYKKDPNNKE